VPAERYYGLACTSLSSEVCSLIPVSSRWVKKPASPTERRPTTISLAGVKFCSARTLCMAKERKVVSVSPPLVTALHTEAAVVPIISSEIRLVDVAHLKRMIWSTTGLLGAFFAGYNFSSRSSTLNLAGLTATAGFFPIPIEPNVACFPPFAGFPFACTIFPLTNLAGPALILLLRLLSSSLALTAFGRSKITFDPAEQYPFPFESDHPSHTNSPRYPSVKSGGAVCEGVRLAEGRFRVSGVCVEDDGMGTISGELDLCRGRLLDGPGRELEDAGMTDAAEEEEGPAMTGCSSSESEEGKKRSGSDLGAIDGDEWELMINVWAVAEATGLI